MKRFTPILAGVLALQLVIALGLNYIGSDYTALKPEEPLLAFNKAEIDQIAISQNDNDAVTLKKQDGTWIVPSLADFPANVDQIERLLTKLTEFKKGWPVATSENAAGRFKTSKDEYERRIVLSSGGKTVGELFIGSSPAYRQVYARAGDQSEVYNIEMVAYEAGTRGDEWMKRDVLTIPRDQITGIELGEILAEKKGDQWTLTNLKPDETVKQGELQRLVGAAVNPGFEAVQGKGKDDLAKLDPPDVTFTVKRGDLAPITYKFRKEALGGAYLLASSEHEFVFRVAETTIEPIVKASREKLVELKKPEPDKQPAETQKPEGTDKTPQALQNGNLGGGGG